MVPSRAFGRGLVLALVVLAAVVPASAQSPGEGDPVVGPELPVSRPVPAPRGAMDRAMAYGGGVFLVAWVDNRSDLQVTRVDRNGAVIDQSGIPLSTEDSFGPAVAFDGTNFLVAWGSSGSIQGRRVSPGGAVLDPAPIELSDSAGGGPAVSFGGGNYLVVWTAVASGAETRDVFGTRLSPDGVVLEPANVPIVAPEGEQFEVDIAFNGTHHLLVWEVSDQGDPSSADIHGALVTTDGVALGPGQPISSAVERQWRPVVTSTGSSFFVAWDDQREFTPDVYGARVAADGSVLDDAGIRIGTGRDTFYGTAHDVSWDGVNALVTWQVGDFGEELVRGARVDPSGTLLDPGGAELLDGQFPESAFDGTHHLVTSLTRNLKGTRVTSGLTSLDPGGFGITFGANEQRDVDMVSAGVNQFVVWTDNRAGEDTVYGARVGPDGQNLDGAGVPISVPTGSSRIVGGASVAFDGTNFLVVWMESLDQGFAIRAAQVSGTGEILNRFDVAASSAFEAPAVAFGNGVFLVGWARFAGVMVARVGTDGTVLDPGGLQLDTFVTWSAEIDIAAGASEFLVVWNNGRDFGPEFDNDVFGAVVTPGGTVVDTEIPIAQAPAPVHEDDPAVAWHDGTYLVVWAHIVYDGDGPPLVSDIHGARVDPSGTVLDPSPLPISTAPGDQHLPEVAFNGRFLVTWADRRRNPGPGNPEADVYAAPVQPDGGVGSELVVGATEAWAYPAVTAAPGDDEFAVVYSRYVPEPPYGTIRAFLRHVSPK